MKTLTRNTAAKKLGVKDTNLIYWERLGKLRPKKIRIGDMSLVIYTPELVEKARKILSRDNRRKRERKETSKVQVLPGEGKEEILVKNFLSKTLPDNFPKIIGVYFYNRDFGSCVDEFYSRARTEGIDEKFLEKYKKKLIGLLEDSYLTLRDTMDRAIPKSPSKSRDEDFLKEYFQGLYFSWRKDRKKRICIPDVLYSLNISSLLAAWTFHVWRGEIPVGKCEYRRCEKIFLLKRKGKKYCSLNCRVNSFRQKKRDRNKEKQNANERLTKKKQNVTIKSSLKNNKRIPGGL